MSPLKKLARWPKIPVFRSKAREAWALLTTSGLSIGSNSRIGKMVVFETHRSLPGAVSIVVGKNVCIEDHSRLETWGGTIDISEHVFIGPHVMIFGQGGVNIGKNSLIAMQCRILSSEHDIPPLGIPIRTVANVRMKTVIGEDVWLGAGVTVLGGVVIGDGCVVGAGSVVTKDLPSGSIAYGVPASVKGWREGAEKIS